MASDIVLSRAGLNTRDRLVRKLNERFAAQVDLKNLDLSVFPRPRATGEGLVIRRKADGDAPPFLSIDRFTAASGLFHLLWFTPHVQRVKLEGLKIHTPRRRGEQANQGGGGKPRTVRFVMDEIIADGTVLEVASKTPGKDPLTFDISKLTLHSAGVDRPMSFDAVLRNPKPPGDIKSRGNFGPWSQDPGDTPVSGDYTFRNADLSVFKGISGILSSDGRYHGTLDHIEVDGTTDVPHFELKKRGQALPLKTRFHSIVDGTNGDTELRPVNALLGRARILAEGAVKGTPGVKGKEVALDVTIQAQPLEDLLRLAVDDEPPLTGLVTLKTKLDLPQGDVEVVNKLRLDGSFTVASAKFTSFDVEQKITSLSRRAKGEPKKKGPGSVLSRFQGRFRLRDGVMSFSSLSFAIPGASIDLTGTFNLARQELDFDGTVHIEAKLSQMTTGIKSLLLKPVDPFFRRNGETVIPVKIGGTSKDPSFGLRLRGK